ncbi:MAG: DUF2029 domain-containing protein [Deltaproteobacteria bacterium]|nr:MAG: DUF2029 domain-containing protein [Deltaproteobacteria bacterium]
MSSREIWHNRIRALALGLGLGLSALIGPCWWSIVSHHHPSCSEYKPDFISLYTAAELMWADRSSLYDLERQRLIQEPIDPSRGDWGLPYFYPPFFAVILVPLAWLSFSPAFVAMTVVNLALLIATVKILVRKLALNRQQTNWLILGTFCNYGVHYALLEAQTSFIALLLLTLYVTAWNGSAQDRAGLWSGLMFFKPQLALVPILLLLSRRRWRALGLAFIVIGFLGLVSLAAVGLTGIERYLALSTWRGRITCTSSPSACTICALWRTSFSLCDGEITFGGLLRLELWGLLSFEAGRMMNSMEFLSDNGPAFLLY